MRFQKVLTFLVCGITTSCATPRRELKDPADPSFTLSYELYATEASSGPWVVILPPTGGANFLDRWLARKVRDRGARAMLVLEWTGMNDAATDIGLHDRGLKASMRAFDLLRLQAGGGRLRLAGTSLGGMYAAAMASHRPEGVEKMALTVSGGPLSEVVARSKLEALMQLKESRRAAFGFTNDDQYQKILFEAIPSDFVGKRGFSIPAHHVLTILALEDTTVPSAAQVKLWEELGRPRRIDIGGGHFFAILKSAWFHSDDIADFISSQN